MTPEQQRAGALEAIERIVNRGGDDVLEAVRSVVSRLDDGVAENPAFVTRVTTLVSAYCTDPEKMRNIFSG